MATTLTQEQIDDLLNEKVVNIGADYFLRLRTEPDQWTDLNDFDCYGTFAPVERDRYYGGAKERPQGFDGMAEIIRTYSGDGMWWQPPADLKDEWYKPENAHKWRQMRNTIREILDFGFVVYVLELCHGTDAYDRHIVVDYSTLGGMEPLMDSEYQRDVVRDLVAEIALPTQDTLMN